MRTGLCYGDFTEYLAHARTDCARHETCARGSTRMYCILLIDGLGHFTDSWSPTRSPLRGLATLLDNMRTVADKCYSSNFHFVFPFSKFTFHFPFCTSTFMFAITRCARLVVSHGHTPLVNGDGSGLLSTS